MTTAAWLGAERSAAHCADGVLTLTLPVAAIAKSMRIPSSAGQPIASGTPS